jgi:RNA polymerase sigma factor (sigma-70 family)
MSRAQQIRDDLQAHPWSTCAEVAARIGVSHRKAVSHQLHQMMLVGMVMNRSEAGVVRYALLRNPVRAPRAMWLVTRFAAQEATPTVPYDDLVQEGAIGAILAKTKYDTARGSFTSAARWFVFGRIRRAVTTTHEPVVSHEALDRERQVDRTKVYWRSRHSGEPTRGDIAKALDVTVAEVERAEFVELAKDLVRVSDVSDTLPDDRAPADVELEDHERVQQLLALLDLLPQRTRWVLKMRFGVGDADAPGDEHTLHAIGDRLGLSRERIRMIEREGVWRLRKLFESLPE